MKSLTEIPVGSRVFETIEKIDAVVTSVQTHFNGCHRAILQERRLKDGIPVKREGHDIQTIQMVEPKKDGPIAEPADDVIGLNAKDIASGYEGIITIVNTDESGARQFALQSSVRTPTGDRVDSVWVAEELVELLEPRRVQAEPIAEVKKGPSKEPTRQQIPA